jgi:hypothetical protein
MRSIQRFTALIILIVAAIVTAGQLSPPAGPVAPTMKSLADLSAEHAAIQAAIGSGGGGGGAPIKRVIHGVITFNPGDNEETVSLEPEVVPAKTLVTLSPCVVTLQTVSSPNYWHTRTGACADLQAGSLTVTIDQGSSMTRKVSYQVIEYY